MEKRPCGVLKPIPRSWVVDAVGWSFDAALGADPSRPPFAGAVVALPFVVRTSGLTRESLAVALAFFCACALAEA